MPITYLLAGRAVISTVCEVVTHDVLLMVVVMGKWVNMGLIRQ